MRRNRTHSRSYLRGGGGLPNGVCLSSYDCKESGSVSSHTVSSVTLACPAGFSGSLSYKCTENGDDCPCPKLAASGEQEYSLSYEEELNDIKRCMEPEELSNGDKPAGVHCFLGDEEIPNALSIYLGSGLPAGTDCKTKFEEAEGVRQLDYSCQDLRNYLSELPAAGDQCLDTVPHYRERCGNSSCVVCGVGTVQVGHKCVGKYSTCQALWQDRPAYYNPRNTCQCNGLCGKFGNCCLDYKNFATKTKNFCARKGCPGYYNPEWTCQCNELCTEFGNCCEDANTCKR